MPLARGQIAEPYARLPIKHPDGCHDVGVEPVDPDLGYFGPGSVTWRLHREPLAIVGGLRALLLQALHPDAMAKMVEVSNFRDDPWGRLRRTSRYVHVVTFGSRAQADRAVARVRSIHRQLGVGDPEQMAWVHAALVDSMIAVSRQSGVHVSARDADRYVAEQVIAAQLIGVPEERIVHNVRELRRLERELRPRLRATPDARAGALLLVFPPLPVQVRHPPLARAGWTTLAALAVGSLPGWARRKYLLPPLPARGITTALGLRTLRRSIYVARAGVRTERRARAAVAHLAHA